MRIALFIWSVTKTRHGVVSMFLMNGQGVGHAWFVILRLYTARLFGGLLLWVFSHRYWEPSSSLRRQSLMSDTLSHVSLSGVAFGLVWGFLQLFLLLPLSWLVVFLEYLSHGLQELYGNPRTAILNVSRSGCFLWLSWAGSAAQEVQWVWTNISLVRSVTISEEQVISLFVIAVVVLILTFLFVPSYVYLNFWRGCGLCGWLASSYHVRCFNMSGRGGYCLMIPAAGALLVSTIMVLPAGIAHCVWEKL